MRFRGISLLALCISAGLLVGCASNQRASTAEADESKPAYVSWNLPKTVLAVTVVMEPTGCKMAGNGNPELEVETTVTMVPKAVPDLAFASDYKNGLIEYSADDFESNFWRDKNIQLKTYPGSHLLQEIASKPTSQVAPIVGNLLTGSVKVASTVFLGPVTADFNRKDQCKRILEQIAAIEVLKSELRTGKDSKGRELNLTVKQREARVADILGKTEALSITMKKDIDPLHSIKADAVGHMVKANKDKSAVSTSEKCAATEEAKIGQENMIAVVYPTYNQLKKANWFEDDYRREVTGQPAKGDANPDIKGDPAMLPDSISVRVYLDFACASPNRGELTSVRYFLGLSDKDPKKYVPKGALYREVSYIPVLFYSGNLVLNQRLPGSGRVPFAQFGQPTGLPFRAGIFEALEWSLSFNEFGESSSSAFGSKATGVGITGMFAGAATAGAQSFTDYRNAQSAVDTETLRLQAENQALQAKINNIDYKKKLIEAQTGGAEEEDEE